MMKYTGNLSYLESSEKEIIAWINCERISGGQYE